MDLKGRGGMNWEITIDICALPCVKQIAGGYLLYSTGSSARCSVMTWMGWRKNRGEIQHGEDIYIYIHTHAHGGDSLHFIAETSWKIPWTEEPGGLHSMGSLGVWHDWATSLSLFIFIHWRRKWQPTPVFLPGESQGWGSLVGCRLWGCTELDMTEAT